MFDNHPSGDRAQAQSGTTPSDRNGAEIKCFQKWIEAHTRYRQAEKQYVQMQMMERNAWREYAESARRREQTTWSDRFADAFRTLWHSN